MTSQLVAGVAPKLKFQGGSTVRVTGNLVLVFKCSLEERIGRQVDQVAVTKNTNLSVAETPTVHLRGMT